MALLIHADMWQDERDTSWMRRPSLLAAGGAKGEEPSDEDELRGNGSPPATWEDRADGDFDRPDGDFENCASWMDTGEPSTPQDI